MNLIRKYNGSLIDRYPLTFFLSTGLALGFVVGLAVGWLIWHG